MSIFSKRFGFRQIPKGLKRDGLPQPARMGLLSVWYQNGIGAQPVFNHICSVTRKIPSARQRESAYWKDVEEEFMSLEWFYIFDVVERVCDIHRSDEIQNEINELLEEQGIGWKLSGSLVEARGDSVFEAATKDAIDALKEAGATDTAKILHGAISALSEKPTPDTRAAVEASLAAVESLAKHIVGERTQKLNMLVKDLRLPSPLDLAIEKLNGYAAQTSGHPKEGSFPKFEDALLVVHICAALISRILAESEFDQS
ncbi:MAG: hypothetical protein Q7S58_03040 [Candidatus Binatus sp.]|nr:hypothetical protein [Candidatus Binatus sp.]MDO8431364.1 hypothetical protein [Candidatus Binatus sp.]